MNRDLDGLIEWHARKAKAHAQNAELFAAADWGDPSQNPRRIVQVEQEAFHIEAAAALRAQQARIDALEAEREQMAHQWNAVQDLALLPALPPGWDDPNKADLWWVSDDPEEGHFNVEEAYDHGNGGSPEIGIVHLERGKRLSDVWAVRVVLTRDEDGEPDDTEVQCFHTKAEAEAALPTPPTETER